MKDHSKNVIFILITSSFLNCSGWTEVLNKSGFTVPYSNKTRAIVNTVRKIFIAIAEPHEIFIWKCMVTALYLTALELDSTEKIKTDYSLS